MKIAYVCPYDLSYPGGVKVHVEQFAAHVSKLGHEVTVIAPFSRESFPKDQNGIKYVNAGVPRPLPFGKGTVIRGDFDLRQLWKIRSLLDEGGYEVIHIHEPHVPLLGPGSLLKAPRSSVIAATFHANYEKTFFPFCYSNLLKFTQLSRLAKKIDIRFAVSEAAKAAVSQFFPGDYNVIPNGIDTSLFSPDVRVADGDISEKVKRVLAEYPDGNLTKILTVGRMGNYELRKGLRYVISSFGKLHKQRPNTLLIVVGPGKPDNDTVAEFNRLDEKTQKHIVFVGEVTGRVLPKYYKLADIAIFAATGQESFGYTLVETMSTETPVIATDIPGYRNVVFGRNGFHAVTGETGIFEAGAGILVRPKDSDAFARSLEMLVDSPDMRTAMGLEGRRIVVENFGWDRVSERILKGYHEAIAAKRERVPQMHPLKRAYHHIRRGWDSMNN